MIKHGAPELIHAEGFKEGGIYHMTRMSPDDGHTWYFARRLGFRGLLLRQRLKLAWGVFYGRYGALRWGSGQ